LRLTPLLIFLLILLAAQGLQPQAETVAFFGFDLPHLCPSRASGDVCLGCGTTRATLHMLHGNFATAWAAKPFVFLFPLVFLLEALAPSLGLHRVRRGRTWLAAILMAMALYSYFLA
jgi:uncharacterized protein DUF2752